VLTGPGPGRSFGPLVRAFELDGQPVGGGMARFMAYGTAAFGVNVAGGNLDGAGVAEIVTGPGPGGCSARTSVPSATTPNRSPSVLSPR